MAYIRVANPYRGNAVVNAIERLVAWAERRGWADHQWLGYQWDNPELVALEDCHYYAAVEVDDVIPTGEIGRYVFPPMLVAEIEIRGNVRPGSSRSRLALWRLAASAVDTSLTTNPVSKPGSAVHSRTAPSISKSTFNCRSDQRNNRVQFLPVGFGCPTGSSILGVLTSLE